MNMGGPADHWYTDIFTWDRPAFGEPIDSLIKDDIRNFGGDSLLRDDLALGRRLWDAWPQWGRVEDRTLSQLAADLRFIRDDLHPHIDTSDQPLPGPARKTLRRTG